MCASDTRGPLPAVVRPRCRRYYNVYHRSDPVAYRIEPLLYDTVGDEASNGAPPPAYVPFAGDKGGERLHVKLRRKVEGVVHTASAVQHWFEQIGDSIGQTARSIEGAIKGSPAPFAAGVASTEEAPGATWALSEGARIDWMLQETELEVANEYLSALQAHTQYFENADVVQFVCDYVAGGGTGGPAVSSSNANSSNASSGAASPTPPP